MTDTTRGEGKKMTGWLPASAVALLLPIVVQLIVQVDASTAAAAGLSEVWSETDGMRMKYSTNHGDLLSSKGSEMSLSSDQRHHQLDSPAVGGGDGGGGAESSGEESSGDQAKGEHEEVESEQADSRKRENVVPVSQTAGRVHSYSSLAGSNGGGGDGGGGGGAQSSGANQHRHKFRSSASSRSTSEAPSSGYDFSGSPSEDQMVNDNGEVTPLSGGTDQSSLDGADDEPTTANETPAGGKFRAPGKQFKEAVRMVGGSHSKQEDRRGPAEGEDSESGASGGGGGGESKDENEEKGDETETPSRVKADDKTDEGPGDFNGAADVGPWGVVSGKRAQEENDYGRPFEGLPAGASPDTDRPMSMAGSPLDPGLEQHMFRPATPRSQMMGVTGSFGTNEEQNAGAAAAADDDDDQQMPLANFRSVSPSASPMYYEGSAQSSRALPSAGSSAHKERIQTPQAAAAAAGHASKRQSQTQTQQSGATGAANKQPGYKQLSYFKSVPDHPYQRAGASPVPRSPSTVRNTPAPDNSPDSVRDNFISPGHYPGSMPHLTQAASEIAQSKSTVTVASAAAAAAAVPATSSPKESAPANPSVNQQQAELSKSSSQQVQSNESGNLNQSTLVSSDTNQQQQQPQQQHSVTTTTPAKQPAADDEQHGQAAESKEVVSVIAVTPSPEAQQESQQIMAPILPATTTTMAPLLPTSPSTTSSTNATPTPAPSSLASSSTTSQTPALKRFKFRKYR